MRPGLEDFHASLWATADRLVGLRRALTRWVGRTALPEERREDVVLATYEAMANCAEHAYPDGEGGPLEVTAHVEGDELRVVVADEGRWKPPDPTETVRGRGRGLIERLADSSATAHRRQGTVVTMCFRLAPV